jgi:hypothetical protein
LVVAAQGDAHHTFQRKAYGVIPGHSPIACIETPDFCRVTIGSGDDRLAIARKDDPIDLQGPLDGLFEPKQGFGPLMLMEKAPKTKSRRSCFLFMVSKV